MTAMGFNPEELKRKFDDESQQGGPIQKLLKTSSPEQLSDIFSQNQFLSFGDDEEDDFDMNSDINDSISDESTNQQQQEQQPDQQQQQKDEQKPQQPAPPQRKKPGRKPNPASPALRKAQNRAAQRAFRERKERHLRELENTIKSLRESLVEHQREISHYQRESTQFRSLIEQLESEVSFLKQVAFTFECALNNINGNNEATTKLKNVMLNGGIVGSMNNPFGLGSAQIRPVTLPSQQQPVPTAQQIQNSFLGLLGVNDRVAITSPATSTVMTSPNGSVNISTASVSTASSPPTPESMIPDPGTFFTEEFAREITLADMKPFVTLSPATSMPLFTDGNGNTFNNSSDPSIFKTSVGSQIIPKSNSDVPTTTVSSNNNNASVLNKNGMCASPSFMAEAATMIDNEADYFSAFILNDDLGSFEEGPKPLLSNFDINNSSELDAIKNRDQLIRLSKKVGQTVPARIIPKTKYPLTRQQEYFLTVEHDPRIDLIPCLHLRSRMIQYRDQYDLYELVELLINKAKCHGDPIDPDSWELPEEFFERYNVLSIQHCRIKSSLYKRFGYLPKDFAKFYGKGMIS